MTDKENFMRLTLANKVAAEKSARWDICITAIISRAALQLVEQMTSAYFL